MKKGLIPRLLIVIVMPVLAGYGFFVSTAGLERVSNRSPQRPHSPKEESKEVDAWLFKLRADPLGSLPADATEKAWRASLRAVAPVPQGQPPGGLTDVDQWTFIGPSRINGGVLGTTANTTGRIVDIAVVPGQPAHWFIASEGGGIWETTNSGGDWTPKTDGAPSLGMTTIAVAPSNPQILYAGTRDTGTGVGLLKSLNGGTSWEIANRRLLHPGALEVHPTNPNIVLAVGYLLPSPTPTQSPAQPGLYRSENGGTDFTQKLPGPGGALEIHPTNFTFQYAAVRGASGGVYRSMDGGNTWVIISGGPWSGSITASGEAVRIAIAPSDPGMGGDSVPLGGTVYIVVPGGGIWRTQQAWVAAPTWTPLPLPGGGFTSAEVLQVDPADPNIFYMGGLGTNFYRYIGSQKNPWSNISGTTHVDQRTMKSIGLTLLLGNDGGFWTSTDHGTTFQDKNSNLATVQFFAGSLHPTNATAGLGGSLDTGTARWSGNLAWDFDWYGDGGHNAFSKSNPAYWLGSAQTLYVYRWIGYIQVANPPGCPNYDPPFDCGATFIAPITRSPHSDVVLAGSKKLWKSENFFMPSQNLEWSVNHAVEGSPISAIAFAPSDSCSLTYAYGRENGSLRLTTDGGVSWRNLDPPQMSSRVVRAIAFHPVDPATIYVAFSNFEPVQNSRHILKSTNAMAATPTWENVTPLDPDRPGWRVDVPMHALAIDSAQPNIIYAGAELGVWKSTDNGNLNSWTFMGPGSGMPNAPVFGLDFSQADGHLVAFTYGRGAFKLNAGAPATGSVQATLTPAGAVNMGAQWRLDGGAFQNSGTTLSGISAGNHTVSFGSASGYHTPVNQSIVVNANQTTTLTGVYSAAPLVANLSTRADIGTVDNVLIGGFIITSPTCSTKTVVLRGMGPSTQIDGYLQDPYLELHKPDGTTVTNDDWADAPNSSLIPGYLRPGDSRESVILTTLGPGAYTVILRGANGETGVGLFEAYDEEHTSPAKLANLSTRGSVQKGDNVMIGGMIFLPPGSAKTVVIRGMGPSLGVGGKLQDPLLELHKAGGSIVTNDNWEDAPNAGEIPSELRPEYSRESVILTTLEPGLHTVILRGASGDTGVGLFEVYPLDN